MHLILCQINTAFVAFVLHISLCCAASRVMVSNCFKMCLLGQHRSWYWYCLAVCPAALFSGEWGSQNFSRLHMLHGKPTSRARGAFLSVRPSQAWVEMSPNAAGPFWHFIDSLEINGQHTFAWKNANLSKIKINKYPTAETGNSEAQCVLGWKPEKAHRCLSCHVVSVACS